MSSARPLRLRRLSAPAIALAAAAAIAPPGAAAAPNRYVQHNLVSDQPGLADVMDPNLVNAWGLDALPNGPLWIADNHTDKSTIYPGAVNGSPIMISSLVVQIPGGAPTGLVANTTQRFVVHRHGKSGAALFIFDSESGNITAWSPAVPPNTRAVRVRTVKTAIFKGLALARTGHGPRLYATDFHNGKVDVFDGSFARVQLPRGRFHDRKIPKHYAPFGIQLLRGKIYVTYAKQDAAREDDSAGPGRGFVDAYGKDGKLLKRLIRHGKLNSPWGLTLAPRQFGRFGGDLLVGNFGDGRISAYRPGSGHFEGQLRGTNGQKLLIDGLWGLRFGNGVTGGRNDLLFTAGPDDENHGLFGAVTTP